MLLANDKKTYTIDGLLVTEFSMLRRSLIEYVKQNNLRDFLVQVLDRPNKIRHFQLGFNLGSESDMFQSMIRAVESQHNLSFRPAP